MNKHYPHLFSPLKLGPLTLKNRIEASAMSDAAPLTENGFPTEKYIAFYEMLAKGGAAIVTLGNCLVDSVHGNNHGNELKLDHHEIVTELMQLTNAVKRHGAVPSVQLLHGGRRADPKFAKDGVIYGPTGGICHYGDDFNEVTEMDEEIIAEVVGKFGDAAAFAKFAGFQMCQVHGGHGWLISQFLARATNQRTDRFGGCLENRARFAMMVVEDIRKKCGPDFAIEFRLSGDDMMENGVTLEESCRLAELLNDKVDSFQVSISSFNNRRGALNMFPTQFATPGAKAFMSEAIKKHTERPVATLGGYYDPELMEKVIAEGKADIITMARELTVDPWLPEKARRGETDEIVHCLRCNVCLSSNFVPYVKYPFKQGRCSVNPMRDFPIERLRPSSYRGNRKVLIAGGGPAGMQAALGAAARGNRVTLCEKSGRLGGMLQHAGQPSFKREILHYISVLEKQIRRNPNIDLRLNTAVTPEFVQEFAPDDLILAVGAEPIRLPIPGIDDPRVVDFTVAHDHRELSGREIVVLGGGLTGLELAIDLATRNKKVTILEMRDHVADGAAYLTKLAVEDHIEKVENIELLLQHTVTRITEEGVWAKDAAGEEHCFPAESVVTCFGLRANRERTDELREAADANVITVGDCRKPASMVEAGTGGFWAGYSIYDASL